MHRCWRWPPCCCPPARSVIASVTCGYLRIGLMLFVAASAVCATASSNGAVIAARLGQGAGGALVLPAALAMLRAAHDDAAERTRLFGLWAAWTGVAGAVGPLLAGVLVDDSWRAIF